MAVLSKPKARVNKMAPELERQKPVEGNSFVFSDKIESWMVGRSQSGKKKETLF
jgi:dipeptidase